MHGEKIEKESTQDELRAPVLYQIKVCVRERVLVCVCLCVFATVRTCVSVLSSGFPETEGKTSA